MKVSIIGTGNMAKAIGVRLVSGGHGVDIHARDEAKGKALVAALKDIQSAADVRISVIGSSTEDIVILATPYTEAASIADTYAGLKGKVVIDITNPIDFNTFQLVPSAGTAGAEEYPF